MAAQQQEQVQGSFPLQQGALFGAGAFIVGYLVTFLWLMIDISSEEMDATFEAAGWLFFNAQFVRIEFDGPATLDFLGLNASANVISLPAIVFTIAVGLILFGAGYLLTTRLLEPGTTTDEGTVYGASIVVGYLPLSFLGALLFEMSYLNTEGTPDIFMAVLIAGIVFPAIIGALGGYYAVRSRGN